MNLKLLILGITGLFAGCVTLTSNDSLYKSYNKFKADTNAETVINKAPLYFSERLLGERYKDDQDGPDQCDHDYKIDKYIPTTMKVQMNFY